MVIWRWTGYNALIYLAAMQAVPDELYEAAASTAPGSGGSSSTSRSRSLRPTIIFTTIISTIGGLQLFTEPYLFQPLKQSGTGGSDRQYQTVAMYLYEKAFGGSEFKFGYASAIAWSLFLLIALICARELPGRAADQVGGLMTVDHRTGPRVRPARHRNRRFRGAGPVHLRAARRSSRSPRSSRSTGRSSSRPTRTTPSSRYPPRADARVRSSGTTSRGSSTRAR